MGEPVNDPREAAADPPSAHATPGGQPGDHDSTPPDVRDDSLGDEVTTVVETPGGTTVSESVASDSDE